MNITRRNALLGGAAALATTATTAPVAFKAASVKAALGNGHPWLDRDLFRAIAHWREARDVYEAEEARQEAIYEAVQASMPPEYHQTSEAHSAALYAAADAKWSPESTRAYDKADDAYLPYRLDFQHRVEAAGYDEDVTGDLSHDCWELCRAAVRVPARTLAGLRAKIEMVEVEYPQDGDPSSGSELPLLIWQAVGDDIRRLAGRSA